jgi:hypothetical protein
MGEAIQRPSGAFREAAGAVQAAAANKRPSPFCIRLSPDERAYLERLAGNRPLGAYIRDRLLGDNVEKRRELRSPKIEQEQYAALLAALGHSHLSSNLNQLAKSANMGTLDISQELERQLQEAYDAVLEMRTALFMALGLKSGGGL